MKNLLKPLALLSVASMLTLGATAQENMDQKSDKMVKMSDKMDEKTNKAIADMLGANMYQVKLLELAQEKGKDEALKSTAAEIAPSYRRMGEELTQWAASHGYTATAAESKKYEGKISKWNNHNQGQELDYDLGEEINDANKDGLDLLKSAKEDTKDTELKGWIETAMVQMRENKAKLDALKERTQKPWKKENRPDPKMGVNNKVQY